MIFAGWREMDRAGPDLFSRVLIFPETESPCCRRPVFFVCTPPFCWQYWKKKGIAGRIMKPVPFVTLLRKMKIDCKEMAIS